MVSYTIEIDNDVQLIRVEVFGEILQNDGERIITEARTAAGENGYDIVYDMRRSNTKVSILDWFRLPRNLDVFMQAKARLIRAAVIISKDDESLEEYRFFETVTRNLGFSLKIFFNEEDALVWLDRKT